MSNRQERRKRLRSGDRVVEYTAGPVLPVPADRYHSPIDAHTKPGEHLWLMIAAYRIIDPAKAFTDEPSYLDLENLMSVDGPGCYVCEQTYDERMAALPCPGEPSA